MGFDNAFIGYENLFTATASTITATGIASGFSASSLKNWQAWDYAQFDAGSNTITLDTGMSSQVGYVALAGHELFKTGATSIVVRASNTSNFATSTVLVTIAISGTTFTGSYALDTNTAIPSQTVLTNAVTVFKLDSVSFRYYRIEFNNTSSCKIGVLGIGRRLDFEQGFYRDAQPPMLNEDVIVTNNKSETGVFLGRSIVRAGVKSFAISLDNLSHDWIYTAWHPFRAHAELSPFFYSWGNTPLYNNQLCYQTAFANTKLQDRIGGGHGSVGITFEGVIQ